jgi:hypothetical protein
LLGFLIDSRFRELGERDADGGACWTVPNLDVRMSCNWTMGRRLPGDAAPETPVRLPRHQAGSAAQGPVRAGTNLAVALSPLGESPIEGAMHHLRYVVMRREHEWKIVQAGRRHSGSYPSRRQAVSAAIEFAERDGQAGCHVEVLVREEDGTFLAEWISGGGPRSEEGAQPLLTPYRH